MGVALRDGSSSSSSLFCSFMEPIHLINLSRGSVLQHPNSNTAEVSNASSKKNAIRPTVPRQMWAVGCLPALHTTCTFHTPPPQGRQPNEGMSTATRVQHASQFPSLYPPDLDLAFVLSTIRGQHHHQCPEATAYFIDRFTPFTIAEVLNRLHLICALWYVYFGLLDFGLAFERQKYGPSEGTRSRSPEE